MRLGYLFGGVLSMLLYKIDRAHIALMIKVYLGTLIKNKVVLRLVYILAAAIIISSVYLIPEQDVINGIVAFSILEISGSTRVMPHRSSRKKITGERKYFYNTVSILSKSLVGTFITPLMIILLFGNTTAMAYGIIYFFFKGMEWEGAEKLYNRIFIIPSILGSGLLYFVYVCRNKTFKVNFKGEFLKNLLHQPLLNIYILGAYIESVNFYFIENSEVVHYLRSYGAYQGKIDEVALKDFITIIYGVAGAVFILFITFVNLK